MELVNDEVAEVSEPERELPLHEEYFKGFRCDHQDMRRFIVLPCPVTLRNVSMPFHDLKSGWQAEAGEPVLLIVDQCLEGGKIEGSNP